MKWTREELVEHYDTIREDRLSVGPVAMFGGRCQGCTTDENVFVIRANTAEFRLCRECIRQVTKAI